MVADSREESATDHGVEFQGASPMADQGIQVEPDRLVVIATCIEISRKIGFTPSVESQSFAEDLLRRR